MEIEKKANNLTKKKKKLGQDRGWDLNRCRFGPND